MQHVKYGDLQSSEDEQDLSGNGIEEKAQEKTRLAPTGSFEMSLREISQVNKSTELLLGLDLLV